MPELLEAIDLNSCSDHVQEVHTLKFLLMTFLWNRAFAHHEWKQFSKKDNLLIIPGNTPDLKRTKRTEHLDNHFPSPKR